MGWLLFLFGSLTIMALRPSRKWDYWLAGLWAVLFVVYCL